MRTPPTEAPLPRVAVFHPGTQRGPHTSKVLDQNGLLAWYATGIYHDAEAAHPLLACLPGRVRANLERELMRRCLPGLDTAKVRSMGLWEWVVVAGGRLGCSRATISRLMARRNRQLGKRVARWLDGVDVLYSYNSVALGAMREARQRGILTVLDMTTPSLKVVREILRYEKENAPPLWRPGIEFGPDGIETEGGIGMARYDDEEIEELSQADLVICGSDFCADSIRQATATQRPVAVLPYGVDVSAFRPRDPGEETDGFALLMVGNIQPEKGVQYLLRAARLADIPGLKVILVGHQNVADEALAEYDDLIEHVPHVPKVEVPAQYRKADIYVLPTLFEGSSNTIYEAMATGLPIVTTPNAGSVVRDGEEGYIVPIRDPEAIARRIQQLYEDEALRRKMGESARRQALRYTWEDYGKRVAGAVVDAWRGEQGGEQT